MCILYKKYCSKKNRKYHDLKEHIYTERLLKATPRADSWHEEHRPLLMSAQLELQARMPQSRILILVFHYYCKDNDFIRAYITIC